MSAAVPSTFDRAATPLRVALIAGSLTQGGAEKQLVYMARALRDCGVDVRVYSLTRGEFYESVLKAEGIEPVWVGAIGHPAARLAILVRAFRHCHPHIVQSTHFFANLYAGIAARTCGAIAVGSIRNDGAFDLQANGRWGPWLLRAPAVLLANSAAARTHAESVGTPANRIHVLDNVINLREFDRALGAGAAAPVAADPPVAIAVCRLVAMKRLDRFIQALARARERVPDLRGIIVGDGPERPRLEALARSLNGTSEHLTFAGRRDDVPALLRGAHMLVHTSDHEGFPNAVLEAMAAGLPVIATPAGDVRRVVVDGETGFVTPFDDVTGMADRMVQLATAPELRRRMGEAGRARVERAYSFAALGGRLLATYRAMAETQRDLRALAVLNA
jgi:glycosyltransferase involved in cell wall biosynthesis